MNWQLDSLKAPRPLIRPTHRPSRSTPKWKHNRWTYPGGKNSQVEDLTYQQTQKDTESLINELGKVEAAGGKVLKEKMSIGEHGFIGVFTDTEGNTVAMHSTK